jgi:hypothetical protein
MLGLLTKTSNILIMTKLSNSQSLKWHLFIYGIYLFINLLNPNNLEIWYKRLSVKVNFDKKILILI